MISKRIGVTLMAFTVMACDTGTDVPLQEHCPTGSGDFTPTDCAVVRGTVQGTAARAIQVDSVEVRGRVYTAEPRVLAPGGDFDLTVLRAERFEEPTVPDTATVNLEVLDQDQQVIHREPVTLNFAPAGEPVIPRQGVVVEVR